MKALSVSNTNAGASANANARAHWKAVESGSPAEVCDPALDDVFLASDGDESPTPSGSSGSSGASSAESADDDDDECPKEALRRRLQRAQRKASRLGEDLEGRRQVVPASP